MSDNKKYYYLKLKENFFETHAMRIMDGMPDRYRLTVLLLKLYLDSLHYDGMVCMSPSTPYTIETLSAVLKEKPRIVSKALDVFQELGLITRLPSGIIYMDDIQNFVGRSSTEGDRKREYRMRIKQEEIRGSIPPEMYRPEGGQMSGLKPIF